MIREIHVDLEMHQQNDIIYNLGAPSFIHSSPTLLRFILTLSIDGKKAVVKEFESMFREADMDDEKKMVDAIFRNARQSPIMGIYDVRSQREQPGDELYITFSDTAKEMFELLTAHKQKLLEAMLWAWITSLF